MLFVCVCVCVFVCFAYTFFATRIYPLNKHTISTLQTLHNYWLIFPLWCVYVCGCCLCHFVKAFNFIAILIYANMPFFKILIRQYLLHDISFWHFIYILPKRDPFTFFFFIISSGNVYPLTIYFDFRTEFLA